MYIDIPNPRPLSNNVDLSTVWYKSVESQKLNSVGAVNSTQALVQSLGIDTQTVAPVAPVATATQPYMSLATNYSLED